MSWSIDVFSGHIIILITKKLGDILVVSVTSDKFVNKGPNRPVNQLNERILLLKILSR